MFVFTDRAVERIKRVARGLSWPSVGTRVCISPFGATGQPKVMISLRPKPVPGDQEIQISGVLVYLEPAAEPYLKGLTVDYVQLGGVGCFTIETAEGTKTLKVDGALAMP